MRHKILITALAGFVPLIGGTALADTVTQSGRYSGDVAGFHGTAASLPDAIMKVESATGGRVVEIRFDDSDGLPGYHAIVDRRGAVEFMHLDARSGRLVTMADTVRPRWMLNWRDRADLRIAETAPVSLATAIATAEHGDRNAPAIAAGIAGASDPQNNVHAYNVLIDHDGAVVRRAVDSATDLVIADAGSLSGWP